MTQPQESKTTAPKSDFVPTPRFYEVLFRLFPDATPNELEELVETMMPELYAEILKMEKRQNAAKGPVTREINGRLRTFDSESAADEYELKYVDYDSFPVAEESDDSDDSEAVAED
jgi:hypothetical protein